MKRPSQFYDETEPGEADGHSGVNARRGCRFATSVALTTDESLTGERTTPADYSGVYSTPLIQGTDPRRDRPLARRRILSCRRKPSDWHYGSSATDQEYE